MRVVYQKYFFNIDFKNPILFDTNPAFILRSVFGMNLRAMSCIEKDEKCFECLYKETCSYASIFETILPKENNEVPGRDRVSHPFIIQVNKIPEPHTAVTDLQFIVILFGKYIEYFPYVYGAFVRAGKNGIGKMRDPFTVKDVLVNRKSIIIDSENIELTAEPLVWESSDKEAILRKGEILIQLLTPLRFKVRGNYTKDFSSMDFMVCLFRRMRTICALYGEYNSASDIYDTSNFGLEITERTLQWKDNEHYSSRQHTAMELGGITGTFTLAGTFSPTDLLLLEFAKLFGAGKNTNFGLGKIDYWTKWE